MHQSYPIAGCGLGFRRGLINDIKKYKPQEINFFEVAPENWINIGGTLGEHFQYFTQNYPFICHGLSLSLGGPHPLDTDLLKKIKIFLEQYNIRYYSEHLSYCADGGHLYDLMPIPFTEEAVHYVAQRIRQTQDILEQKIAIENTSAYIAPGKEMEEIDFVKAVLEEADCKLLLDVNNVYVNSINFEFEPIDYLSALPKERIAYCHIAGHCKEDEDLIVDTHGADVIPPVWDLLDKTYDLFGVIPTLLERDFNFPAFPNLIEELCIINDYQQRYQKAD